MSKQGRKSSRRKKMSQNRRTNANTITTRVPNSAGGTTNRPSVNVELKREAGARPPKPPLVIAGRSMRELQFLLASSVALAFAGLTVIGHFWLDSFFLIPPITLITSWRCTVSAALHYGVRFAPYPAGSVGEVTLKLNRQVTAQWLRWLLIGTFVMIWLVVGGIVLDIFIAIMIVCVLWCVGFIFCFDVVILSVELDVPERRVDHGHGQVWRYMMNDVLSQGLTGVSTGFALLGLIVTFICLINGSLLHVWPFVLALAFAYVLVGSVARAARVRHNRIWIEVDGVRLLSVLRQTLERGIWWSGGGTFIGTLVGGLIVWAKHKTGHEIIDLMGASITFGAVTGTVIALFVPTKLAWLRRRELRSSHGGN